MPVKHRQYYGAGAQTHGTDTSMLLVSACPWQCFSELHSRPNNTWHRHCYAAGVSLAFCLTFFELAHVAHMDQQPMVKQGFVYV